MDLHRAGADVVDEELHHLPVVVLRVQDVLPGVGPSPPGGGGDGPPQKMSAGKDFWKEKKREENEGGESKNKQKKTSKKTTGGNAVPLVMRNSWNGPSRSHREAPF